MEKKLFRNQRRIASYDLNAQNDRIEEICEKYFITTYEVRRKRVIRSYCLLIPSNLWKIIFPLSKLVWSIWEIGGMGGRDIDKINKTEKVFSRNRFWKEKKTLLFKIQHQITHVVQILQYLKQICSGRTGGKKVTSKDPFLVNARDLKKFIYVWTRLIMT